MNTLNITHGALQMRKLRQRLNDLSEIPSKSVARRGIQLRILALILHSEKSRAAPVLLTLFVHAAEIHSAEGFASRYNSWLLLLIYKSLFFMA